MGTHLSNKYGQKLLDSAKKSTADAIKTASKRVIQKTTEATDDLIGSKIADKTMSVPKKSAELSSTKNDDVNSETGVPKRRYISPEKRQQIIDEIRLV